MNKPLVFISYSHQDEVWKDRLLPQLEALVLAEQIVVWDDRKIDGGDKWYPEIENAMATASVAVCLISEHYLASKFCVKEEIPFLLKREQENQLLFLPVLLSPCPWKAFRWLSETQMLPRDGQTMVEHYSQNNWAVVFAQVADLILKKINEPDYQTPPPTTLWPLPEKIDISHLPETGNKFCLVVLQSRDERPSYFLRYLSFSSFELFWQNRDQQPFSMGQRATFSRIDRGTENPSSARWYGTLAIGPHL